MDDVSFIAGPGRVTGLLGPNGAGKTTTLRMLLGLVTPSGGVARIGRSRYEDVERPVLTVGALLEASGAQRGGPGGTTCGRAGRRGCRWPGRTRCWTRLGSKRVGGRRVRGYSLGMRQRLGMAVALLGDPQVLILDEPGNGLDPAGIRWTRDLLRALAASGRTVLVSSHQLAEVGKRARLTWWSSRPGVVVACGTLESVTGGHAGLEEAFLELTAGRGGIR